MTSRLDIEPTWEEIEEHAAEMFGEEYRWAWDEARRLDMECKAEQDLLKKRTQTEENV